MSVSKGRIFSCLPVSVARQSDVSERAAVSRAQQYAQAQRRGEDHSTGRLTRGHWDSPSLGQPGSGQIVSLEGSKVGSFIILYDEI